MKNIRYTAEQLAIICTTALRVAVWACPGSGKTETLCARVRRLLDQGVRPEHILVLSFSDKAVSVLKERLPDGVVVKTFHAFGFGIVRSTARAGSNMPVLLTPKRSVELLKQAVQRCPKARRSVRKKTGISLLSPYETVRLADFIKRGNGSDQLAARLANDDESGFSDYVSVLAELRAIRFAYNRMVERAGAIDYPSMLRRAGSMMDTAALPFTHLLVDEVQDMSEEQATLLAALAGRVSNITMFGDPNQAVYGFIGANVRDFRNVIRDVVTLGLTRSFRLTHENAALAGAILSHDNYAISGSRHGVTPSLVSCASAIEQEDAIVGLIRELIDEGVGADSIAILGRTKAQIRLAEHALLAAGVETDSGFSERQYVHVFKALDVLTLLLECIKTANAGLKPKRDWRARRLRRIVGENVKPAAVADCLRLLAKAVRIPSFEGRYVMAVRIYLRLVRAGRNAPANLAAELGRWQPVCRQFDNVRELRAHVLDLSRRTKVVTSTIHGAKGDEWGHVFVLGVTEGSIPFYRELNRNEIDEERRLFYVAVTRARKRLYLLQAPFHHAPSGQSFAEKSRFLTEAVKHSLT